MLARATGIAAFAVAPRRIRRGTVPALDRPVVLGFVSIYRLDGVGTDIPG